jgi:hypothetical protein
MPLPNLPLKRDRLSPGGRIKIFLKPGDKQCAPGNCCIIKLIIDEHKFENNPICSSATTFSYGW